MAVKLTRLSVFLCFSLFFVSVATAARVLDRGVFDSFIRMMMSDGAEDRQGESGAVTLRGLKLEAGLKKVLINNDVLWLRGPVLTLSPKSQDV